MVAVIDKCIEHPGAWRAAALGGKAALCQALTPAQLDAFDAVLAGTRHLAPQDATRADFDHPALRPLYAQLFELLQHGRGAVILTGLTPARHSEEDMERIWWGIGTWLGVAAVQSAAGERLGHVREDQGNPKSRGYNSARELDPHTDSYEIIGLLCLQKAVQGGSSSLVSALSVHNEVLRHRPDLLAPLYEGFPYATVEMRGTDRPVTDYAVPVYSQVEGVLSCAYLRNFMRNAADLLERPMPARLVEALDYFDATCVRPDLALEFMLEPGEMMLCNNYVTLHWRGAFVSDPARPRHLLRLWLNVENGRKVLPELLKRAREYRARAPTSVTTTALA